MAHQRRDDWASQHIWQTVPVVAAGQRSAGSWIGVEQAEQDPQVLWRPACWQPASNAASSSGDGAMIWVGSVTGLLLPLEQFQEGGAGLPLAHDAMD
jgi:hypothetical protein